MARMKGKASLTESLLCWSRILNLWRVCDKAACRRAGACRGNIHACASRNFAAVPEGVQAWFCCLMACKKDGMSFETAMARLKQTPAEQAWLAWQDGEDLGSDPAKLVAA